MFFLFGARMKLKTSFNYTLYFLIIITQYKESLRLAWSDIKNIVMGDEHRSTINNVMGVKVISRPNVA